MSKTVVLAFSGGLDTTAAVRWLREHYGARVFCYTADVGQVDQDLALVKRRARDAGADGCYVDDLRDAFLEDVAFPTLKAGAVYARKYLLGTAIARPVTAAGQVAYAKQIGADALAHGCTGKGNDQVRFELTYHALAPRMQIIAPWREWAFKGRGEILEYLGLDRCGGETGVEFSRDSNLWHCSHEGGCLEDPARPPPDDMFLMTNSPAAAPDVPQRVAIGFESGKPTHVDGVPLEPVTLLKVLNETAGLNGVGRADVVEDRLVGMKSRGVYETPGGTLLYLAHRELEQLVLDRKTLSLKDDLASRYADLLYEGRWWSVEREALDALVEVTQRTVTGTVELELYKGSVSVTGRWSPWSLYSREYATFEGDSEFNQSDAQGFIRLFGLPLKRLGERAARADGALTRGVERRRA